MGKSYFVPRNVKGESRILYIFTMKSFITTAVMGLIGFGLAKLVGTVVSLTLIQTILFIAVFGGVGYAIGALKIPDSPVMGPFRKAGGEELTDILLRFITFNSKKKVYIYNLNREEFVRESILKKEEKDEKEVKLPWMR